MKVRREPEFSVFYPFGFNVWVNAFMSGQFSSDVVAEVFVSIDRILRVAIVSSVKKLEQVAENLCAVAAVDLLDYKVNRRVNVFVCLDICVCKCLRDKCISDL